jgi:hypothetical protein
MYPQCVEIPHLTSTCLPVFIKSKNAPYQTEDAFQKEVDFTHCNQIREASTPPPFPTLPPFLKNWHNKPYAAISPSRPELSVHGKNIVVTGGGTRIGPPSLSLSLKRVQNPSA